MKIGEKLRKLRDLHGFDQKYLADKLEVSTSQYCKYEKDETPVNLDTVEKIASVYKITFLELLSWDEKNVFNFLKNQTANGIVQHQTIDNTDKELVIQLKSEIAFLKEENIRIWNLINPNK